LRRHWHRVGDGVTDVATETTATDTSTTVAATTGALESCNAKGTSYVAVTTGGGAGVCSDPLAAYCCTETEVLRQFPSLAAKLKTQIDTFLGQGLKLYNCSLSSAGKTTLHFAAASSGGVQYHNLFFTGVSASGGASTGACAKVGSAELGLTQTDAVDDSGAVATSGTVPAVIGPDRTLANTSPSNLLAELNLERYTNSGYRTWTVKDHLGYIQGLQIYAKVYWNSSLAADLATSPPPASHRLGSISVMEAFADAAETQFQGWYVLGKASAANPDGWFTYQMTGGASAVAGGTPSFPAAPQTYEMGAAACSACHKTPAYPSYIIGP
jgi:hypothetical protein